MKFAVVIEKSSNGYAAYLPDVPGCVAAGDTLEEARSLIQESLAFHLEGLRESGGSMPEPSSSCEYVTIAD